MKVLRVRKLGVGRTVIDQDGLAVRDEDGYERLAFTFDGDGAELVLTRQGNDAVALSAHGTKERPFYPGSAIALCSGDGEPVVAWHVELKGAVNRLVGDERRRSSHYQALGGEVTVTSSSKGGLHRWKLHGRFGESDQ